MFVHADRSSSAIIEYEGRNNKGKSSKYLGYDSVKAIEIIERSQEVNQVKKWLELLEPVLFVDVTTQNLEKQITILNVISMYCRNQEGGGVYPY